MADAGKFIFQEGTLPTGTPDTGTWWLYFKSDGLYMLDDADTETNIVAPTAEFITSAASGGLSAEVVIPSFAGSPDIEGSSGGGAIDREFDNSGGTLFTWDTSPLAEDIDTTAKSYYYVQFDSTTATDKIGTLAWSPGSGAFDARCKIALGSDQTATSINGDVGLHIGDSGNSNRISLTVDTTTIEAFTYAAAAYTQRGSTHAIDSTDFIYLRIVRDGSNNVSFYFSKNGIIWKLIATQSFTLTIANIGIRVTNGTTTDSYCILDWLRTDV